MIRVYITTWAAWDGAVKVRAGLGKTPEFAVRPKSRKRPADRPPS